MSGTKTIQLRTVSEYKNLVNGVNNLIEEGLHRFQEDQAVFTDTFMITSALEAQVKATLALAEQQRIANLITLLNTENGPDRVLGKSGDWGDIYAEVVSALGIGDDDE